MEMGEKIEELKAEKIKIFLNSCITGLNEIEKTRDFDNPFITTKEYIENLETKNTEMKNNLENSEYTLIYKKGFADGANEIKNQIKKKINYYEKELEKTIDGKENWVAIYYEYIQLLRKFL